MNFAVVDIETTGLTHQEHGITEVAVVYADDNGIKPVFHSLLHPDRKIPKTIAQLTGINDDMVQYASGFNEISSSLLKVLENRVFVAHNVNFDYGFLKTAFEADKKEFRIPRFCVMRYAAKMMPYLKSYRLENVCNALQIENEQKHRAMGDAMATAQILVKLMERDTAGVWKKMIKQNSGVITLPGGLGEEKVNAIPQGPGVYYFYSNTDKKPIYVGKAKKLQSRVRSHFISPESSREKQLFQVMVSDVKYKQTQNEYEALLLEDKEIKKYRPAFNKAQKNLSRAFAVVPYQNRRNKTRLAILKSRDRKDAIAWFNTQYRAHDWLYKELLNREINPQVAGMYAPKDYDEEDSEVKLKSFIQELTLETNQSYVLSLKQGEPPYFGVLVNGGKYRGYGYFTGSENTVAETEAKIIRAPHSVAARSVIRKMLVDENVLKHVF